MNAKITPKGHLAVPDDTYPEPHEFAAADFFLQLGKDVAFIKPSRTKGTNSPDIEMDGLIWEIKTLMGKSKLSINDHLSEASHQASNIILDLRQYKQPSSFGIREAEKQFQFRRRIKKLILILPNDEKLDFRR